MKNLFILIICIAISSCVSTRKNNSLLIDVTDMNGKIYSSYIVKVSNEKGEFIYSHVVNDGFIKNVNINYLPKGLYKVEAICMKTSMRSEKIVDHKGKKMVVDINIPNTQPWLKGDGNSLTQNNK